MKLKENRELWPPFIISLCVSLAATAVVCLINPVCGLITGLACTAVIAVSAVSAKMRYRKMAELSEDIDRMLYGGAAIELEKYSDGEISLLYSQLYKLVVGLKEQSEQLAAEKVRLADSIADISHQIRTPLTSINLIISKLAGSENTDEKSRALVRELYDFASHVDRLVDCLLKLSKLDAGTIQFKCEHMTLADFIKKACEPFGIPLELRDINLEVKADGEFYGDISWSCEAIGNIVKNCMEHTPAGGVITISAEETAIYSEIIISDSGEGISADDLPHIFERFYRGKRSDFNSVGIGLALARTIIKSQNGTICAGNNPDKGAFFKIRFYKSAV